jgi:hypothetical protein
VTQIASAGRWKPHEASSCGGWAQLTALVADALCAHPFRQMYEAIDYQIARRIGYRIGWAGRSPFIGE